MWDLCGHKVVRQITWTKLGIKTSLGNYYRTINFYNLPCVVGTLV